MTGSNSQLLVSVGICTRNRAHVLRLALARLSQLQIPSGVTWELLVIDNGSSDETADILRGSAHELPLRALSCPTPGKSNALNFAMGEARGDYILWTDDDVLVDSEWITGYVEAFRRWPDAAFFGGPVEPWFEGTPPEWLANHWPMVANVFAVRQLGDTPFQFDSARVPYGANFAVKAAVQRQFPYDPMLGPQPGSEIRGEETKVIREMLASGLEGWWVPRAKVRHLIPRHRQSLQYVRQVLSADGEVRWRGHTGGSQRFFGKPRLLFKRALAAEMRYRWSRMTDSPDKWLKNLADAAALWGRVKAGSDRG